MTPPTKARPPESPRVFAQVRRRQNRPWLVTLGGYLVLLEGVLMFAFNTTVLLAFDAVRENEGLFLAVVFAGLVIALHDFATGLAMLRRRPNAWVNALIIQVIVLTTTLLVYYYFGNTWATDEPLHLNLTFFMMFYGVFMVAFLNQAEVANAFRGTRFTQNKVKT